MSTTTILRPDGTADDAATAQFRRISDLSDRFERGNPPPWDDPEDIPEPGSREAREANQWHDARWDYIDAHMADEA